MNKKIGPLSVHPTQATVAFVCSSALLFGLTMLTYYTTINWEYMAWAATRIFMLSALAGICLLFVKVSRLAWSAVFGSALGLAAAVAYVWLGTRGT